MLFLFCCYLCNTATTFDLIFIKHCIYLCSLMKFFAFIMAFLILALSVMPCADANAVDVKAKTEFSKHSQPHPENHPDACSPLCACNCCSGVAFFSAIKKTGLVSLYVSPVYNSDIAPRLFSIALPIWQPPQLV